MSHLAKRPWLLLPLLVFTLQSSWGQAPSGEVDFFFSSPSTAVYDLSSPTYEFDQNIIGAGGTPLLLAIPGVALTHERSGRLHGTGQIQVFLGNDEPFAARYTASGQVSGGGFNKPVKVQLSIRLSGNDLVSGVQTGFSISVRYNLVVDPGSMALVGSARGRASFTRLAGGGPINSDVVVPLPDGVDGTWSAVLNVQPLNRLSGSGNLVLSTGRTLPVRLNGNFVTVSGLSKLRLNGFFDGSNDGRGSAVRMDFFTGDEAPSFVNGTILGQKVMQ